MNDWKEYKLGDVAEFLNGRAYKATEFKESGMPIVRIQNLTGVGNTVYSDLELPEDKYIEYGDLIYAWSATFGPYIWKGEKSIYHYHIWKIRCNHIEKLFLYYHLLNASDNLKDSGNGTLFIHITKELMESFPILLPPLSEQRAIAAVLSSLDDKIDLLHRQNKTLEAMAETLFNEQFIMNNEEWKMGKLGDIATFYNGKSRPKESGEIPVYGGNGILEYTNLSNYGGKSIIIGRVGAYCGSLYFENRDIWVSDNALLVKANNGNHTHFLFYLLKSLELNSMAEGSSHPLLTQTLLKSIDINVPPNEKIESFEFQLEQWTNKMDSNISQIQTLTKLRDTLLPKLMSGEVRVTV